MTYTPGDILLVNDYSGHGDLIGNLIRAGEKSRYGKNAPPTTVWWTHSAVIVSADGDLVEAMEKGVERGHVSEYAHHQTKVVHLPVRSNDSRRAYAVRFAEARVGDGYGVLDFVGLALSLLFNVPVSLHTEREPICSELCTRATEACTDSGYRYSVEQMMPLDIDAAWGAPVGEPLPVYKRWLLLAQALYWAVAPWKSGLKP